LIASPTTTPGAKVVSQKSLRGAILVLMLFAVGGKEEKFDPQ
jgi:hypothetical protein